MQKVLQAAIDCIEEYGVQKTTIRAIASKAGLNSAAINYYFENKDELIRQALDQTLKNAFDVSHINFREDDSPARLLERLFEHWLEGNRRYPGIIRAYFYEPFVNQYYNDAGMVKLKAFVQEVENLMVRHGMEQSPENSMKLRWVFSAFFNNILLPGLLGEDIVADVDAGKRFLKLHYQLF